MQTPSQCRLRAWYSAFLRLLLSAFLLPSPCLADAERAPLQRIGQGDPRAGYETADYQTRSRSLATLAGQPADLAHLAANPPLGLPHLPGEPPSAARIDLGRRLFFDRRLSANETLSCGMCHVPEQGFTQQELATPVGIEGRFVRRNAPALFNVGYRPRLFHDGRETDLATQIWAPLLADNEMGNPSRSAVLDRVHADPDYRRAFTALFDAGLTEQSLGQALAAYQRALLSADSPFDRWYYGGDSNAMTAAAKRGFLLFNQHGCQRCHTFSNRDAQFTDEQLYRTGIEFESRAREALPIERLQVAPGLTIPISVHIASPSRDDDGLQEVTGNAADLWRYRTPSLRNVAVTAPYMHDGSLVDLAAVIDFYDRGAGADPDRDPSLVPLNLSATERSALIEFLHALNGANLDALAADARSAPISDRQFSE